MENIRRPAISLSQSSLLLAGLGVGALATYLFDPSRGRRRRAIAKDKIVSISRRMASEVTDGLSKASRDAANRLSGFRAEARSALVSDENISDEKLTARVRSKLGRVVSHPQAIEVESHAGTINLRGPILKYEVGNLLSTVASVRGVKDVVNDLEIHTERDIPALQGGVPRPGMRCEINQSNWSPAFRLGMGTLGAALLCSGLKKPTNPTRMALSACGLGAITRAATNKAMRELVGGNLRGSNTQRKFSARGENSQHTMPPTAQSAPAM